MKQTDAAAFEFTLEELEIIYEWYESAEDEFGPLENPLHAATAEMIKDAIKELKPKVTWEVEYNVIHREPHYTTVVADTELEAQRVALSQAVDRNSESDEINIIKLTRVKE